MAKSKKSNSNPKRAANNISNTLKQETEPPISIQEVAKDDRTRRIIGMTFILFSLILLFSFYSYFTTWQHDQSIADEGFSALLKTGEKANNLLGRFGAVVSHFFIYKGFGIASLLICTFFFIVGVNLLAKRKIFSIVRNLKYVTLGMLILSVALAFIFSGNPFPYGGNAGQMINEKLIEALGRFGTAAILSLVGIAYIIWQFNPSFNYKKSEHKPIAQPGFEGGETNINPTNITEEIAHPAIDKELGITASGNKLHKESKPISIHVEQPKPKHDITLVEKDIVEALSIAVSEPLPTPLKDENKIVDDLELMQDEIFEDDAEELEISEPLSPTPQSKTQKEAPELTLEINNPTEPIAEPKPVIAAASPTIDTPYEPTLDLKNYKYPPIDLLVEHGNESIFQDETELENNKNQIITTLRNYAIEIQKISATVGPTVTLYEIVPAAGVRISRIKNLEDDIALSLSALGIRIIAPIPGKGTIGIEVPNAKKSIVSMKTLIASEKFQTNKFSLPIGLGKKIDNENFVVDLASMPHLLMAGATGQGKSVGLNAILVSLLYKKHPSQLKFVLVDPKKVELSIYSLITNHFLAQLPNEEEAIITDTKKVINTLNALCIEMDNRYDLLKEAGCRNIKEYNQKFISRKLNPEKGHQFLPFIVLVVDEFADLIMTAGKEVEMPIARLAQLARAVGIHLIIATQRPSVNIITGTIKANFPARIAFKVSSKIDSRTILDIGGAEQLIGKGDMLISYNGELVRLQCAFVDTPEVDKICDFIGYQEGYPQAFLLPEYIDEKELEGKDFELGDRDSLFEDAAKLIVASQVGSTSLLQRKMKLGYNRAGRLMDQLEAAGIVGATKGSKPRDVLIKTDMELSQHLDNLM